MEKHLNQSVLERLPYGYQSILKQSISSDEDDMGIMLYLIVLLQIFYSCNLLLCAQVEDMLGVKYSFIDFQTIIGIVSSDV